MACKKNYCGALLGSYQLIAECGCGPVGCVYLGRHISSLRPPAVIKLFQSMQLSPHQCSQFLQEVRLLKKLKHPYILPILDAGFFEGFPYLVSENAINGSLEDYLRQQSSHLPLQESLRILLQIGQALHYAHQHKIIHGNLKANNILFNASGNALLADFRLKMYGQGLPLPNASLLSMPLSNALLPSASLSGEPSAQRLLNAPLHSDDTVSASALASEMYGTSNSIQQIMKVPLPWYAPEQAEGCICQESDQYTLGRIAFELLIGQIPLTSSDSSAMQLIHPAEPLSSHTVHIEQVLHKSMATRPTDRYADILAFITALRASTIVDAAAMSIVSSKPDEPDESGKPRQAIKALQHEDAPSFSEYNERILAHQQTVPMLLPMPKPEPISSVALELAEEHQENEVAGTIKSSKTSLLAKNRTGRDNQSGGNRSFYLRWVLAAIVCGAIITYAFNVLHAEILSVLYLGPHAAHISKISPMPSAYPPTLFTTPSPSRVPSPVAVAKQGALPIPTPTPSPTPKPTPIIPSSLVVSPSSLNAQSGCAHRNGWICTVTLTPAVGSQSPLYWSASSNGITGISFKPSSGTLSNGESMVVTIFVPKTRCSIRASFIFSGSSNSISVPWSC